ncbi:MAG: alpha/beta hydrolase [Syntrophales bacterium]|nr:alpha/beta hydrolase [Syntrophales bacterium]
MRRKALRFSVNEIELYGEFLLPEDDLSYEKKTFLVFLHEGLGSVGQWKDFPDQLCEKTGLPGFVYDRWGYGKSSYCPAPRTVDYLHREAIDFLPVVLNRVNIEKPILIGHSDGGSIALIYSGVYPDAVKGVITEAAHVFVEEVTLNGIREAVKIYEKTDLKKKLAKYHGEKAEVVFRGWSETWLSSDFRDWNIENFLRSIKAPLLVIQGRDDQYGSPSQVEAIVRGVSGMAEPLLIGGCGHIPHFEARDIVLNAMCGFIERILKAS